MASTDRTIERLARKFAKEDETYVTNGLLEVLASPTGRRWLWHHLTRTHVFSNPHTGNALNTAFACGEQNIGQQLLADITSANPDAYILMMKENADAERARTDAFDRARYASDDGADDGSPGDD